MVCIFMLLTALFTAQPLITMNTQASTASATANSCSMQCGKAEPEQKTENKNYDTTARCNASSCCFVCQYLPASQVIICLI